MGPNYRSRWAAIGAAVAVSIGAGGLITLASAAGPASTFTPLQPCRLLDTRVAFATGATPPRTAPLGAGETLTIPARGTYGNCVGLSATATGAVLNVTIAQPTDPSFLTVWPADQTRPTASSLNWTGGQGATPNQVTTALDAAGQFSLFNAYGTVEVIVDVVGLYEPAGAGGPAGPPGAPGAPGAPGVPGADGAEGAPGAGVDVMTAAAPDANNSSGEHNSMLLDIDGNPVISHYDSAAANLVLTHCDDPACAPGGDVTNTVDPSAGDVGQFTSLALDGLGNPVISYYDVTNGNLKLAHCTDATCTAAPSITTVDSTGVVGQHTSLALDAIGLPVISYFDNTGGALKVAHCTNANCTAANSVQIVDTAGITGLYTSIELFGGFPTVAYYDSSNEAVTVVRCNDANCAPGGEVINPVEATAGISEQNLSLALDAAGNPVISFLGIAALVDVAHCFDNACAALVVNELPDPDGVAEPAHTSIVLDSGVPVVSYFVVAQNALRVSRCLDANCLEAVTSTADNNPFFPSSTGGFTSIVIGTTGNPIVSSYDNFYDDLVITRCAEPFCNPRVIRSVG